MKTPSEDLFRLIKKLTPKEARFLEKQLQSSMQKHLFQRIKNSASYEEEKIKKSFYKKFPNGNFSYQKHRLLETLIKLLPKISYGEDEQETKLKGIRVLLRKELYALAAKEMRKLKKKLKQTERFQLLIQLLQLQHNYLAMLPQYSELHEELFEELLEYTLAQHHHALYQYFYVKMYQNTIKYDLKEADKTYSRFKETFPEEPKFATLQTDHYSFLLIYSMLNHQSKEVIKYNRKLVDIFIRNNRLLKKRLLAFVNSSYMLLNYLIEERRWEDVLYYFSKLCEHTSRYNHYQTHLTILRENIFLQITVYSGYLDTAEKRIGKLIKKINRDKEVQNSRPLGALMFYLSMYFFLKKDYTQALRWIERTLDNNIIKQSNFIYSKLLLVRLIVLYESGNINLLPYALRSVYYALSKKVRTMNYERFIIRVIQRILKGRYLFKKETDFFKKLYLEAEKEPDLVQGLKQDFDLYLWLRCKAKKLDMAEFQRQHTPEEIILQIARLLP